MSTTKFASEFEPNAIVKKLIEVAGKDDPKKLPSNELKIFVKKAPRGLSAPSAPVTVGPLSGVFYPEFFSNDCVVGTWGEYTVTLDIWQGFKKRILAAAKKVSKKPAVSLISRDLTKPMSDSEIRAELPPDHVFAIDDLWMVAELIRHSREHHGEYFGLVDHRFENLFYFQIGAEIIVVSVSRYGSNWFIDSNSLGYQRWSGGTRVFSRNG